jgi:hypothetical protein
MYFVSMNVPGTEEKKMDQVFDRKMSRRTMLKGVAVVTGVALASTFAGKAAAAKSSKAAVKYQDKPHGDQECSKCTFFIPGKSPSAEGTCKIVEGSISPQGWCTSYSGKG